MADLTTTIKTTVVAAINQIVGWIGDLTALTTTEKSSLVGAVNELDSDIGSKEPLANPSFTGLVTTAGQVKFSATQSASEDVNTLDDYKEGTFTPTIVGSTNAGTGTYTTQSGQYTKIGNLVFVTMTLAWSAHTGTGNILIEGLPYTASTSRYVFSAAAQALSYTGTLKILDGSSSGTQLELVVDCTFDPITMDTEVASLIVTGWYQV